MTTKRHARAITELEQLIVFALVNHRDTMSSEFLADAAVAALDELTLMDTANVVARALMSRAQELSDLFGEPVADEITHQAQTFTERLADAVARLLERTPIKVPLAPRAAVEEAADDDDQPDE